MVYTGSVLSDQPQFSTTQVMTDSATLLQQMPNQAIIIEVHNHSHTAPGPTMNAVGWRSGGDRGGGC